MRILQVNSALGLGGGETHVLELTRTLKQLGHDVVLAGRRGSAIEPDIHFPFLNSLDVVTVYRLRRLLNARRFDILHAHVGRDYTLAAAAAWGLPHLKVVMTRHLLYPLRRHALYRRVDGWIAPTPQILKTLAPLKPQHSAVVPNWVNVAKVGYRPRAILHSPVNIGLLGQISPHKGHDDAIQMVRLLGSGFRLRIAGKGESPYVEDLKKQSTGLPVEFLGFVSLHDFFEMTDVLIAPSWEEPFGIVLLEAMAAGIPVVSTARAGPLDIVRNGRDGILVEPRNPSALAEAVQTLTADSSLRHTMVKSARDRVETEFDIQKVIPRIEAFYEELLGSSANS